MHGMGGLWSGVFYGMMTDTTGITRSGGCVDDRLQAYTLLLERLIELLFCFAFTFEKVAGVLPPLALGL